MKLSPEALAADPEVKAALARMRPPAPSAPTVKPPPDDSKPRRPARIEELRERVGRLERQVAILAALVPREPTTLEKRSRKLSEATKRLHQKNPEFHAKAIANLVSQQGGVTDAMRRKISEKGNARWALWRAEQAAKEIVA